MFSSFNAVIRLKDAFKKKLLTRFSGHGLPNIFHTRNTYKRIIWGLLWLLGFIIAFIFVKDNVGDYFSYDVEIKSRVIYEYPMVFPKVTFCNKDPFTTNSSIKFLAQAIRKHTLNETKFLASFDTDLDLVNYFVEHENEHSFKVTSLFFANMTDLETKKSMGYSIEQFVHSCQFSVWKCDLAEDFEWTYNYKLGNCFTFNPSTDKQKMINLYQPGKMNGLQLELFTGKRDDFDSFTYSYGAKVFIYNHTTVYSESDSIDISVGQETNIALSKKLLFKLRKPYSECEVDFDSAGDVKTSDFYNIFLASNYTYRQDDCMTLCYQMTLVRECNCFDFAVNFFNLFGVRPLKACGKTESKCMEKIFRHESLNYYDNCHRLCPKECQSVEFGFDVSFSQYPSNTQLKRILKKNRFLRRQNNLKNKILKVNIHFNQLSYELIKESPALNIGTLFANVGGTLGLFLGWSVLSIFEILELIIQLLVVGGDVFKEYFVHKVKENESDKKARRSLEAFETRREISYY